VHKIHAGESEAVSRQSVSQRSFVFISAAEAAFFFINIYIKNISLRREGGSNSLAESARALGAAQDSADQIIMREENFL
jgi:hypothetical protein